MTRLTEHSRHTKRPLKRRFSLLTNSRSHRPAARAAIHDPTPSSKDFAPTAASVVEEELRANLSAELRAQTQPLIASLSSEMETLRTELAQAGVRADHSFQQIQTLIGELVDRLQHVARAQQAPPIEKIGLERALESYCQHLCDETSLEVAYESQIDERAIHPTAALAAFRIAQDALSHAAKYRRPNFVSVKLAQEGSNLHLRVEDMGEEPPLAHASTGEAVERNFIERMQQRASECAGRLEISRSLRATLLALQVPLFTPRSACAA